MDVFFEWLELEAVELFFYEVFDGFDVVVGCFFDLFDIAGVMFVEGFVDFADIADHVYGEVFELSECCGEGYEVFDLDLDAVSHEA